jgi:hypothetical protein
MTDGRRSCLGFVFLGASFLLALIALFWGWIGWDFRTGAILSGGFFAFFSAVAVYMFVTIRDYAWLPAVFGGLYTILPDLIAGPVDDIGVLAFGALLSGLISWRRSRSAPGQELPPQTPKK